jgi:hypothetical protein
MLCTAFAVKAADPLQTSAMRISLARGQSTLKTSRTSVGKAGQQKCVFTAGLVYRLSDRVARSPAGGGSGAAAIFEVPHRSSSRARVIKASSLVSCPPLHGLDVERI